MTLGAPSVTMRPQTRPTANQNQWRGPRSTQLREKKKRIERNGSADAYMPGSVNLKSLEQRMRADLTLPIGPDQAQIHQSRYIPHFQYYCNVMRIFDAHLRRQKHAL